MNKQQLSRNHAQMGATIVPDTTSGITLNQPRSIKMFLLLCSFVCSILTVNPVSSFSQCTPPCKDLIANGDFESVSCTGSFTPSSASTIGLNCWSPLTNTPHVYSSPGGTPCGSFGGATAFPDPIGIANIHQMQLASAQFYQPPSSPTWSSNINSIQTTLQTPLVPFTDYTISFWAKSTNSTNSIYASTTSVDISTTDIEFGVSASPVTYVANGFPSLFSSGFFSSYSPIFSSSTSSHSKIRLQADGQWHYYSFTFTYNGAANLRNLMVLDGTYDNYLPAGLNDTHYLWSDFINIDQLSLKPANQTAVFMPPAQVGNCIGKMDLSQFVSVQGGTFYSSASGVLSTSTGATCTNNTFDASALSSYPTTVTFAYVYTTDGCTQVSYGQIRVINKSSPTTTATASHRTVCAGDQVTLTGTASPSSCSYSWTPVGGSNGVDAPTTATTHATPVYTTIYTLVVTDPATLCTAKDTEIVYVPALRLSIDGKNIFCSPWENINLTANVSNGTVTTYTWSASCGSCTPAPNFASGYTTTTGSPSTSSANTIDNFQNVTTEITVIGTEDTYGCEMSATTKAIVPEDGSCVCNSSYTGITAIGTDGVLNTSWNVGGSASFVTYYIDDDVVVEGDITINNATIFIKKNKTITVSPTSSLTLSSTHILTCDGMWNGIYLDHDASLPSNGRLFTLKKNMIEDAYTAISVSYPMTPSDGSKIIDVSNTVFNRNAVAFDIEKYHPAIGFPYVYPFTIQQNVITSRDFSGKYFAGGNSSAMYPLSWPTTITSGTPAGLAYPYNPYTGTTPTNYINNFKPPYTIDAQNAYSTGVGYPFADCKDGAGVTRTGVYLYEVGNTTNTGAANVFSEIQIGIDDYTGSTGNKNVFDNLMFGIQAYNSNFTSVNNAYMNMQLIKTDKTTIIPPTYGGDGVYASGGTSYTGRARVYNNYNTSGNNEFYDCHNGVELRNYTNFVSRNSVMKSTHDATSYNGWTGENGYDLASWKIASIDVGNNNLTNLNNGIKLSVTMTGNASNPQQQAGIIYIDSNIIKTSTNYGTITNEFCNTGITVNNLFSSYSPNPKPSNPKYAQVNILNNVVSDAYNGIYVSAFAQQAVKIDSNRLSLRQYADKSFQYGIEEALCTNSIVRHNDAVVDNYGNTTTLTDVNWKGIYMSNNQNPVVACNMTDGMGTGVEYFGNNPGTRWILNNMYKHKRGLVLNTGQIGIQTGNGSNGTTPSPTPIDNQWLGGTWSSAGTNFTTYNLGLNTTPLFSKLYVRGGTGTTVVTNTSLGNNTANPVPGSYITGTSLVVLSIGGSVTACADVESDKIIKPPFGSKLHEGIAQNLVDSAATPQQRWISQYGVWQAILADSSMADSSAELTMFKSLAAASRYAYITAIEDSITNESYSAALALISDSASYTAPSSWVFDTTTGVVITDDASADNIINNYLKFYYMYINYRTSDTIGLGDSTFLATLAYGCPLYDGLVVYQARTLYSRLFDTLIIFDDNKLCSIADTGAKHSNSSNAAYNNWLNTQRANAQQYILSPNPNNGNITIAQKITDNMPVYAEVWNAVGQAAYKGVMLFDGNMTKLQLEGITPGLYIMLLTDSQGKNYTLKFIVNK